jgi:hypothetical protein
VRRHESRRSRATELGRAALGCLLVALAGAAALEAPAASARVLLVGTYRGQPGGYTDVEATVQAASPGDWILVAPGDYHEAVTQMVAGATGDDRAGAGVLIRTAGIHLRGMDRNGVVIDGTKPASSRCSSAGSAQDLGPNDDAGKPGGRNGILVYKAANVSVENVTVCNYLSGDLGGGNEVWFDGGASTGTQTDLGTWDGDYLSATNTYFSDNSSPSGSYGIYSSNSRGPGHGTFAHDYASDMHDSGYYVGACADCNVTLDDVHAEYSPQGYSGTNSGGHVLIENSEFDQNSTGVATGDLNNDDQPSPQDGTCPGGAANPAAPSGVQRVHSCWVFIHNDVHDNNNPNVPTAGIAGAAPVGTGILLYGGRHDVITQNRFVDNGAWGALLTAYPDTEQPPDIAHCAGGADLSTPASPLCLFDVFGNEIAGNTFTANGGFGNPGNGDIGETSGTNPNANADGNCYHDNVDTSGTFTSDPPNINSRTMCGSGYSGEPLTSVLGLQAICDSQALTPCPQLPAATYPRAGAITLPPPPPQPTMPDPCRGVPANAWCATAPPARACTTAGSVRIRLHLRAGERLLRVTIRIRGRRTASVGGARLHGPTPRVTVSLRGLRHRTVRVVVTGRVRTRGGRARVLRVTRVYRVC